MITKEDVTEKVRDFIREKFPEISVDAEETGALGEISQVLFDMLTGEEPQ